MYVLNIAHDCAILVSGERSHVIVPVGVGAQLNQ